jgi:hypothetical protein
MEKVVIPLIAQPAMLAAIHHSALLNFIIKIKYCNRPAETPTATPKAIEPNLSTPRLEAIAQPPIVDINHHRLETAPRLNEPNAMLWKIPGRIPINTATKRPTDVSCVKNGDIDGAPSIGI